VSAEILEFAAAVFRARALPWPFAKPSRRGGGKKIFKPPNPRPQRRSSFANRPNFFVSDFA
jgi:hypothetical protein